MVTTKPKTLFVVHPFRAGDVRPTAAPVLVLPPLKFDVCELLFHLRFVAPNPEFLDHGDGDGGVVVTGSFLEARPLIGALLADLMQTDMLTARIL